MQPIRVFMADDHAMLRTALRSLLESHADLVVAGEAADGDTAVAETLRLRPDVVTMDLSMPGLGGIEATRRIAECADARVLILTMAAERDCLLPALLAGAHGYVSKTADPERLIAAVHTVARGELALSPTGARLLVQAVIAGKGARRRRDALPRR